MQTLPVSQARADLKRVLDRAARGLATSITRHDERAAVVDAERLRGTLALLVPADAQVVKENAGVSVILDRLGIAADGDTLTQALEDTVAALREYAEDWSDHLSIAPNHTHNWGLVQLVELSSDDQLLAWLTGAA